jgi:hypothetical protein
MIYFSIFLLSLFFSSFFSFPSFVLSTACVLFLPYIPSQLSLSHPHRFSTTPKLQAAARAGALVVAAARGHSSSGALGRGGSGGLYLLSIFRPSARLCSLLAWLLRSLQWTFKFDV